MSWRFAQAVEFVLRQEGDWTHDSGGPTRYGISQRAFPDLDLSTLTVEQARAIYRRDYWDRLGLDALPWPVPLAMLDVAVNTGRGPATRRLQRAVNLLESRPTLRIDGILGPATKRAVRALGADPCRATLLALMVAVGRLERHARLAAHEKYKPYLRGWALRCVRLCAELAREWAAGEGEV